MYIDDTLEDELEPLTETVDLDYDYTEAKDELKIYNFEVPEDKRQQNIGSETMKTILSAADEAGFDSIRIYIARTLVDADISAAHDPTVEFLQKFDFTILAIEETVEAKHVF